MIIAIDGSYGVGKTTATQCLAKRLGFFYLGQGALIRAFALKVLDLGLDKSSEEFFDVINKTHLEVKIVGDEVRIFLDGQDRTEEAYSHNETVDSMTSFIAKTIPDVITRIVKIQKDLVPLGNFVFEGRTNTSKVFPDAEWRFYMEADKMKRAERMYKFLSEEERKIFPNIEEYSKLDHFNKKYPYSDDVLVYDNTNSPSPEQDAIVLEYYIKNSKELIANSRKVSEKIQNG